MSDFSTRLQEAAIHAYKLSRDRDDLLVEIKLRGYGFYITVQREVGDEMVRQSAQVTWLAAEDAVPNRLVHSINRMVGQVDMYREAWADTDVEHNGGHQ